jgi:hypothetical protein
MRRQSPARQTCDLPVLEAFIYLDALSATLSRGAYRAALRAGSRIGSSLLFQHFPHNLDQSITSRAVARAP